MRNLGVPMERADVRWVGARRKKSTQVFELILLFTSVDGLFCLGTREKLLLVQWRHSTATPKNNYY